MDFGLAKLQPAIGTEGSNLAAEAPTAAFLTQPGTVIGTVPYMSPEQVHGQRLDARTDVFSFGVLFYEMLTGQKLFATESPAGTISAILTKEPPPLIQYPEELQRVVRKCLEKDREGRYQTMGDVAIELEEVRRNAVIPSGKAQSTIYEDVTSVIETARPTNEIIVSKRKWRLGAGLALLLVLLIGSGLVYRWLKSRSAPFGSIAVLPFKNETNNKDFEWLSDGMPDSLINSLSQIPNLSVKSRSSVFRYKDRAVDPEKVAAELSVQTVLEGRIMQHGDDLTISLSLVDGSSGNQVWGQQYDRKISQLVTLQSEIARDVSEKLRVRISRDEQQKLTKDYTTNPQAYELYMRGRVHVFKLVPDEVQQGIKDFQRAIDLDPNYALAYVGLSEANRSLAMGSEFNPVEYLTKAKTAAAKALALDGSLSEAHTAWGATVFWADRNWSEAESHYQLALELNPKSIDAHLFYAHLLSNTGRFEESLMEIRRARELDPANPFVSSLEGQFLTAAGRPDDALNTLKETSALAPGFWFPHIFAASAYIAKGMNSEAIAEAHRASELAPGQTLSLAYEGYALGKSGKSDEARAIIDKLLKLSQEPGRWVPPYHIATVYNGLGKTDETIVWLNKALEQQDPKLAFLKVDRTWNNLRNDQRFQQIMTRAGF
jgi:serine/threonine-protein kinase